MREVPLPRDYEGREIPMNTEVLYDINGKKVHITSFKYSFDVIGLWGQWKVFSFDIRGEKDGMLPADSLYLTPPDSWEKLEEDLDRCIEADCISHGTSLVLVDIKQRIRKLRGEGK